MEELPVFLRTEADDLAETSDPGFDAWLATVLRRTVLTVR